MVEYLGRKPTWEGTLTLFSSTYLLIFCSRMVPNISIKRLLTTMVL
jgi:hypothetical protein